ncbi:unnamed protein product, partial [Sphacelaria rigidula]
SRKHDGCHGYLITRSRRAVLKNMWKHCTSCHDFSSLILLYHSTRYAKNDLRFTVLRVESAFLVIIAGYSICREYFPPLSASRLVWKILNFVNHVLGWVRLK